MDPQEAYFILSFYSGPFAITGSIICGIAIILHYSFKKQRRFPNHVLVWTCLQDLLINLYLSLKYTDGPIRREMTDNVRDGSFPCRISMYIELGLEMASSISCVITAFTLYSGVVKNVDYAYFKIQYYKWFMGSMWAGGLLFPLLSLAGLHSSTSGMGICSINTRLGLLLVVCPWAILFLITVLAFIIPVFVHIIRVNFSMRAQATHMRSLLWLYIRFFGILFNQLCAWLNIVIWDYRSYNGLPPDKVNVYFITYSPLMLSLNGFIVIAGNVELRKFILKTIDKIRKQKEPFTRQITDSNIIILQPLPPVVESVEINNEVIL